MFTSSVAQGQPTLSKVSSINDPFKWIDLLDIKNVKSYSASTTGTVDMKQLNHTNLQCTTCTEAGKWENRMIFIKQLLTDLISHCPKDEPLVLISLGSNHLLMEYILGKGLIENGFQKLSFFLVDPRYKFGNEEELQFVKSAFADFEKKINADYHKKYKEKFPKENIHYLSRAQNVGKYISNHPNVVVVESLPQYGETIKLTKQYNLLEKSPENLISECGLIVPPDHANAIQFVPVQQVKFLEQSGAKFTYCLPLAISQLDSKLQPDRSKYYAVDWGCKIYSDGTFNLTFYGEKEFLQSLGISGDTKIKMNSGQIVIAKDWVLTIKASIESLLLKEVKLIKENGPLLQEHLTSLLQKAKEIVLKEMPSAQCYFIADCVIDRAEMMSFLSSNVSYHYRKKFTLEADLESSYKITVEEVK